jgi:hypothetical protein
LKNLKRRRHLGGNVIHGRVILKWIIKKEDLEFNWFRMKFSSGLL